MNSSNPQRLPKHKTFVDTVMLLLAQLEKNTGERIDSSQVDSEQTTPHGSISVIKSKFEKLNNNNDTNETTNAKNKLSFPNAVIMAHQQHKHQLHKKYKSGELRNSSNNEINGQIPSKLQKNSFRNAVNVVNAVNGLKSPPPIPPRSKPPIGGIKPIIPPSPSVLKNNLSPTILNLPNSAPLSQHVLEDTDNPFDDSKGVDPFADDNELPLPLHDSTKTSTVIASSPSRPRRHSHTPAPSNVIKRNKLIADNLIDLTYNLQRSASQTVSSKPLRKPEILMPNSSRPLPKCHENDPPSLPPKPSNRPPAPALSNRPQLPPRKPNMEHHNEKKSKQAKVTKKVDDQADSDSLDDSSKKIPDASCTNRRPPKFHNIQDINSKNTTRTFAIAGEFLITGSGQTRIWSLENGSNVRSVPCDDSITSLCWRPTRRIEEVGRYIWCGAQDGYLYVVDIDCSKQIEKNKKAHNSPINFILRHQLQLWTLDDSGKLQIWSEDDSGVVSLNSKPKTVKVLSKPNCAIVVGHHLWLSYGKSIVIHNPLDDTHVAKIEVGPEVGNIRCMTQTDNSSLVYTGHDDGTIGVHDAQTHKTESTFTVSTYCINSLLGVGNYLWVGFKTGMIYIYDVQHSPWVVIKHWQAHKAPIIDMQLDNAGLWRVERLQVASLSDEGQIIVWDGLMHDDWIDDQMFDRENDYCTFRDVKVLICSWNIDASKPEDLERSPDGEHFLTNWIKSTESPDIIVFGFQEMINLESKKMTAKMLMTKKKNAKQLSENITQRYKLWHDKLVQVVGQNYEVLEKDNLVGLFTCIFAKKDEREHIRESDVALKKTGLKGYHGNKGSIATRFIYDDTSICFVNCHLAAGQLQTKERNTDAAKILDNTTFPSKAAKDKFIWRENEYVFTNGGDGSMVLDHEIVFFSGDLNYRINLSRNEVLEAIEKKDYKFLTDYDQLAIQRIKNPGFRLRQFLEGEIVFKPTYKYNPGEDEYDTSEKKRIPAWCDRILYRPKYLKSERHEGHDQRSENESNDNLDKKYCNVELDHYLRHECKISDHRPISGAFYIKTKKILEDKKDLVREEVEKAWKEKAKEELHKFTVRWLESCGWDEQIADKTLRENHRNLRKTVDQLSKRDEKGKRK
ncbi:8822_t:CDS:2 [Funneliformis mosseae]|uniref:8822_t:CDS:1 n=1 Tax=Funneliformis mosseae TaxID=27381 RepID=A0A9N8VRZ8_FUNMO|nr:8822_t:CDS:2 [Funneliformis mosseae]